MLYNVFYAIFGIKVPHQQTSGPTTYREVEILTPNIPSSCQLLGTLFVHTRVPLSSSSITCLRLKGGDALQTGRQPRTWRKLMAAYNASLCGSVAGWLGRRTCNQQVTGSNPSISTVERNPGQVVNTRASVTKQYNLVPADGRWCLAGGKVTVGLASHWPRVGHYWFTVGSEGLKKGYEHPLMLS